MKVTSTNLPGVLLISPERFGDERGFFAETYNKRAYLEAGIDAIFVQDNHSLSKNSGTLRGLHYQLPPFGQAKLVRCGRGSLVDVAVDIRLGSPTYGQWCAEVLSYENGLQLFIPEGFAHGFMTLEDNTELVYKCSNFYSPEHEGAVRFDDPDIAIEWPKIDAQTTISKKDVGAPLLRDVPTPIKFEATT